MSETKFTTGPWFIDGQGIGPKSFADDQSYGITMPVAYIEEYDWPEDHRANAHLIAAAPDMYKALEDMANIAECSGNIVRNARAALAKIKEE